MLQALFLITSRPKLQYRMPPRHHRRFLAQLLRENEPSLASHAMHGNISRLRASTPRMPIVDVMLTARAGRPPSGCWTLLAGREIASRIYRTLPATPMPRALFDDAHSHTSSDYHRRLRHAFRRRYIILHARRRHGQVDFVASFHFR